MNLTLPFSSDRNPSSLAVAVGSMSRFPSSLTISRKLRHCFFPASFASYFSSSSSGGKPQSVAYLRSMLRPPSSVASWKLRRNSCSFIGTLGSRVQWSGEGSHGLLAFAFLEVKSDHRLPNSSCFSVCLWMQGKLAEISLKHLKPNDFIYVSGALGSYKKYDASGEPLIFYKVYVKDLNYVGHQTAPRSMKPVADGLFPSPSGSLVEEMAGESGPAHEKQHLGQMHLWQLFFASPSEWWDNRQTKRNPSNPDFKHKDTKECLWLSPDDPPWVKKQLELYDASIGGSGFNKDANDLFETFNWEFEDF